MNSKKLSLILIFGFLFLTACGSNPQLENSSVESVTEAVTEPNRTPETEPVTIAESEIRSETAISDFSTVEGFITNDPKYSTDTHRYQIYIQKVMLTDPDGDQKTEIVVCAKTKNLQKDQFKYATIAAVESFYDCFMNDNILQGAKKTWFDGVNEYAAEDIISACLDQYYEIYGDQEMQMYQKYTLANTFED